MIKRFFILTNIILLTIAAYTMADLIYDRLISTIRPIKVAMVKKQGPSSRHQAANHPFQHYDAILKRNLFKTKKVEKQKSDKINLDQLKKTELNLKLWGTVSGSGERAYAVIEDLKKRKQNLYRKGDTIQEATVSAILREKVILNVNGKDEVLQMEDIKSGSGKHISASRTRATSSRSTRAQRISLRRSLIERSMQDMGNLMGQINIQPYLENGVPSGMALSRIKPNSIFRRMGLRNGDVIKGVDGEEIRSVDDALKLYENLKTSSKVSLQLKRRGKDKTIEYIIR